MTVGRRVGSAPNLADGERQREHFLTKFQSRRPARLAGRKYERCRDARGGTGGEVRGNTFLLADVSVLQFFSFQFAGAEVDLRGRPHVQQ